MEPVLHPAWSYDTNIYEVNVRQYTLEGTFAAFEKHLPRLRDMGVEILWFMPVTPISLKDRKGTIGSYYAVQNYTEANPEFGTVDNFVHLVSAAHTLGFKIIIDWVANHSGNDNVWIDLHPDFYEYDADKQILHPHGWEDVSKLNFENADMQDAMIEAMKFWITRAGIDGFRCDMAHLVPLDFWRKAKAELDKTKRGLFWLAECEEPQYHAVFDATYTWRWMHETEEFVKRRENVDVLAGLLQQYDSQFSKEAFRIYFTSNHDENSWNGTEYEKYNGAAGMLAVFSCTWNGIPMVYSGQELPNYKRLKFFDKDQIDWDGEFRLHNFYKTLLEIRKSHKAFRAGDGTVTRRISTNRDDRIFAFLRTNEESAALVVLNFSSGDTDVTLTGITGAFVDIFNSKYLDAGVNAALPFMGWGYYVFVKTEQASFPQS